MKRILKRASVLLPAFVLLCTLVLSGAPAEDEDDLIITDLLDEDFCIVEEISLDEPHPARDLIWHTPNERSDVLCDHETCFWNLRMGDLENEAAIWEVLTQPITVLKGSERNQHKVQARPEDDCTDYVGCVTYASQGVHVLKQEGEWSLIEAYSTCTEGSSVKVWAEPFQGWVKTELLEEKPVSDEYGIVIDKLQQRLYVFKEGKLFSTLLCSTGFAREDTPFNETPAGEFIAVSWTGGFWSGSLFCDMGIRINDGILMHEVPCIIRTDDDGTETKDYSRCERYLGEKASHGCIRIQKEKTPEGVNMKWLWDNLSRKPYTKVIIWDEVGRELGYPSEDYPLYYNTNKGKQYHSSPTCTLVNSKYWPLTEFTWGELEEKPYAKLTRCPGCSPQLRGTEIDTVNSKNTREP